MEKIRTTSSSESSKPGCMRYAVAVLLLIGGMLSFIIRGMLSVAIVAMVKPDAKRRTNFTHVSIARDDVCPGRIEESSVSYEGGPYEWDEQQQGEILASFFYGFVATQFLGGWATDKYGGRLVLGAGVLMSGIFSILSPGVANVHHILFMATRALQGAFAGVVLPSTFVIMAKWYTLEERARIGGFVFSASSAGNLVCMSVSGVLVDALGWTAVFYVFGGICVFFILPWAYFVYDAPEVHPRISYTEKEFIVRGRQQSSDTSEEVTAKRKGEMLTPWKRMLTSAPFWAAVGMASSFLWITNTLLIQMPSYIANVLHFNIKESGFLSALPYFFACIFGPVFGSLSSWLCSKKYISRMNAYRIFNAVACLGPAGFLLLVVLLGCDTPAIISSLVLTGVMLNGYYGGSVTNLIDLAPNFAGSTSGISLTVSNMTGIVAPLIYGAVLKGQQTLSRWHIVFYITVVMGVVPYLFFLIFGSADEQTWNKPQINEDEEVELTTTRKNNEH